MELNQSSKPGNGPERFAGIPPKVPEGLAETREILVQVRKTSEGELVAARERIERVKADAADRAVRMGSTDRLDLSSAASALIESEESTAARGNLVAELKAAYDSGTVNTQSRIERAAGRLLGAE